MYWRKGELLADTDPQRQDKILRPDWGTEALVAADPVCGLCADRLALLNP
jgi:hypothetical protein